LPTDQPFLEERGFGVWVGRRPLFFGVGVGVTLIEGVGLLLADGDGAGEAVARVLDGAAVRRAGVVSAAG
jgi:hypothetical protein